MNIFVCFSALLDKVRKDVVNKAILNLPKRESLDILKMCIEMSKAKEAYSLTDLESAYFAYVWIGQNIEYDNFGDNYRNSSNGAAITYKEGKGGAIGITGLFNTICNLLNIESNTVVGITKLRTFNFTQLIKIKEYAWNYILIDNEYYLIDVIMGSYNLVDNRVHKIQSDFYFGLNPEIFIRLHFPNENKWQLLPKTITKDEFISMAYLFEDFYTLGLKTITPDAQTFSTREKITFKLTSDSSFDDIFKDLEFTFSISGKNEAPEIGDLDIRKISNGSYQIKEYISGNCFYYFTVKNKKTQKSGTLMYFESYNTNNES